MISLCPYPRPTHMLSLSFYQINKYLKKIFRSLFLIETGPWFLKTFPIKEDESSSELPEIWKHISKASICNALNVGDCSVRTDSIS